MDADNTEGQPQQETPRHSTGQEEQVDDGGLSAQRVPSDGDKLPEPKAPGHGQSEQQVFRKKDVKVKRDPSTTAARPGAVAVPGLGATATTCTARKPSGIVPQTNQLREPSELARPPSTGKKNPAGKIDPNVIAPLKNSEVKMKEKATRANSQASDTAVQSVAVAVEKLPLQPGAVVMQEALTQQNTKRRSGLQQPAAQPGAVAVQGPVAALRKRGSTDQTSQPRKPAAAAKKGSKDEDIESGLLVPASGMVDEMRENVRSGDVSSGDDVRPGAVAVQPGTTITAQSAEMSFFSVPTMHTPSPNILTSKAAIANRTAAVQGKASMNGMEALDMARPSNYVGSAVTGDNTVHTVTAYTVNEVDPEASFQEGRLAGEAYVRQQMITKVVDAEIVEESKVDQPRRRRRCLQFSMLIVVVIVAVVVGSVVGSQSGGGSIAPPSMAPSMSAFSSAAPTETPNNDFCGEALNVTDDNTVIVESLQNTTVETRQTCSSEDEIEQRGRWYEYTGNGLGLTVEMQSAVEDATAFEILVGNCEDLQCTEIVASSNATLNFVTAENTTYLIHVFSTLDAMSEPSANYNLKVSDNSACGNAYPVDVNTPTLYFGSTAAGAVSDLAPSCNSATVGASPGVWFDVVGDGMNIEASTCGGASFDTQISVFTGSCGRPECVDWNDDFCGSQSSVLWLSLVGQAYFIFVHGATANATGSFELSMVKRPVIDTCEGGASRLPLRGGKLTKDFSDFVSNNADSAAASTVQGTLIGASMEDPSVPTCGVASIISPGVWYTVIGTGGRMRAGFDESGEETDFDARVSVFRGSCSSLECVEQDVEQDGSLRWNSTASELYYMLVYGADALDGSSGNFSLFVDPGNELCTDVVNPLPTNGTIVGGAIFGNGSNASSIDGLPLCDGYPFEPSTGVVAWFSVVGTGGTLLVSSCEFETGFDVAVYSGSCGNLTCVEGLEEGRDFGFGPNIQASGFTGSFDEYGSDGERFCPLFVNWESVKDEVYYIIVEAPARDIDFNLLEYLIRVTEYPYGPLRD